MKLNIMEFAGAWKHLSNADIKKMKLRIIYLRKRSTKELLEKLSRRGFKFL